VDGLLIKINDDFLKNLESRGLIVKSLKVRFLIRDLPRRGNRYRPFNNLSNYKTFFGTVLNASNYLCSSGDFPVIENIEIINNNFKFTNAYNWYNITENRYFVKKIQYDSFRKDFYESEVLRYESLMHTLIDRYITNVNKSIDIRLNSYVDPCYVDAGYVSPNSDPIDFNTLSIINSSNNA
jgi:hypothetical protein